MCLAAFAIDRSRRFPLVLASNRDEFFARPTAGLDWWNPPSGGPAILSGRDLESGGTWMGLTAQGRLALLTNVRSAALADPAAPSRGRIVTDWLSARDDTGDFWMRTAVSGYNGFNLVAFDFNRGVCFWASNAVAHPRRLDRGVHGVSNGALDDAWPKVDHLKSRLAAAIDDASDVENLARQLFADLADRQIAPDENLPRTGVPIERERALSPAFIHMPDRGYGTRCSSLVITERVGRQALTHVFERSFDALGRITLQRRASLRNWPPPYVRDEPRARVETGEISETRVTDPVALRKTTARRARVRALLAPVIEKSGGQGPVAIA